MIPVYDHAGVKMFSGDARKFKPPEPVQCVITSPPYWGLRDYGIDGQIGLEETPLEYVRTLVRVFRRIREDLRDDGTVWLNMGDTYASVGGKNATPQSGAIFAGRARGKGVISRTKRIPRGSGRWGGGNNSACGHLKPKDMIGIPWRVAFALQDDGWYLRSEIIWHKPNPMPESVSDRPTKSHEQIFLLSKSERYYYDAEAIAEPVTGGSHSRGSGVNPKALKWPSGWSGEAGRHDGVPTGHYRPKQNESFSSAIKDLVTSRNKRSVWTIPTEPFPEAHFATFPRALILPCVLAGCPEGGTVYDPFMGAGTTALVAKANGRKFIGLELTPAYIEIAARRIAQDVLPLEPESETKLVNSN